MCHVGLQNFFVTNEVDTVNHSVLFCRNKDELMAQINLNIRLIWRCNKKNNKIFKLS